jgi:ABC-2 type transport system ATP-binding protein
LSDVERVCDRIALIDRGALILDGSVKEIKERNANLNEILHIEILSGFADNIQNLESFISDLKNLDFIIDINHDIGENININVKTSDKQKAGEVIPKIIANYNGALCKFEFEGANLEDIFVSATAESIDADRKSKMEKTDKSEKSDKSKNTENTEGRE